MNTFSTPLAALAYYTDCQSATVSGYLSQKGSSTQRTTRQVRIMVGMLENLEKFCNADSPQSVLSMQRGAVGRFKLAWTQAHPKIKRRVVQLLQSKPTNRDALAYLAKAGMLEGV